MQSKSLNLMTLPQPPEGRAGDVIQIRHFGKGDRGDR